jgi:hypothetical protein
MVCRCSSPFRSAAEYSGLIGICSAVRWSRFSIGVPTAFCQSERLAVTREPPPQATSLKFVISVMTILLLPTVALAECAGHRIEQI